MLYADAGLNPLVLGSLGGSHHLQAPVFNSFLGIPSTLLCVLRTPLQVLLPREALFASFSLFLFLFCGWGLFSGSGNFGCLPCLKLGDLKQVGSLERLSGACHLQAVLCEGTDWIILSPGLFELVTTPRGFSDLLTGGKNPPARCFACVGVESWGFRI